MSNLVVNLNRIRAAAKTDKPERAVFSFHYFAPESEVGQTHQNPLVKVVKGSLRKDKNGEWLFKGINLFRINDDAKGGAGAVRHYKLNRINGLLRRV